MRNNKIKFRNPNETRVVVTGIGTINPLGNNVREYWNNLVKGKSGIRRITSFELNDYSVQIAGEVDLPDTSEYFKARKMMNKLDRYIIFSHIAGSQAIKDSGIEIEKAPHRIGTLIGTGDAGLGTQQQNITRMLNSGMQSVSPYYVTNAIPSTGSAFFAQQWNLQGPSFSVSSACSTSNIAIGVAASLIKMGLVDVMLAGGSEAAVNAAGIGAFGKIFALSDRNDSPETASRPFDKDRDGFVMGEGSGVLCLEEYESARQRNAHIYCEIKGFCFNCDAYDLVAPHPDAIGASRVIEGALDMARLNPEEIGLINTHGTSTPLGDIAESIAINRIFKEYAPKIPVHSTKSMVGHLLGAASAVEAIAAIMAIEDSTIHPTINLFEQDPQINLNVLKETTRNGRIDHILSNAFGFGGQNAVLVLSRC